MGDVIHTLPAVHALRQAFPQAFIGWLIEERWAELLCAPGSPRRGRRSSLRPLVDEVHTVNLKAWGKSPFSVSTLQHVATVWNDVRDARYDAAVDLQGAIRSAVLARWSGARVVYGAAEPRESPASLWYTRRVVARGRHVIEQNLSVAEGLVGRGMKRPARICAACDPQAEARIEQRLVEFGMDEFAILNPGAGWGAKRWPAERYGEVARALAERGVGSILNYGPGEEELVARGRGRQRRDGPGDESYDHGIDRVDAPGATFYWRRHGADASGCGAAGSGGGDFWTHRPGAQRALWDAKHCAAKCGERYFACAAGGARRGIAGDWE